MRTARIEREYAGQLKRVAREVGKIIDKHYQDFDSASIIDTLLHRYAEALTGWAKRSVGRMLEGVARADKRAWHARAEEMGKSIAKEIRDAPIGEVFAQLMAEQVDLIKSIPRDAAQRVHHCVSQGLSTGQRADEVAAKILETKKVTESRAMLIARTETSRAASNLTQARAQLVGSTHYIWRTAGDGAVRSSHADMEGQPVPWSTPPTFTEITKKGKAHTMKGHAGCLPNCRCWAEPVLPK